MFQGKGRLYYRGKYRLNEYKHKASSEGGSGIGPEAVFGLMK
jgi:hypothetical protein